MHSAPTPRQNLGNSLKRPKVWGQLLALALVVSLAVLGFKLNTIHNLQLQLKNEQQDLQTTKQELDKKATAAQNLTKDVIRLESELDAIKDPSKANIADIIDKVGKLHSLPTDEVPTIATVSDITKLTDQPFFAQAKNGDLTLIYSRNSVAVLYRPSTNQVITYSTVSLH